MIASDFWKLEYGSLRPLTVSLGALSPFSFMTTRGLASIGDTKQATRLASTSLNLILHCKPNPKTQAKRYVNNHPICIVVWELGKLDTRNTFIEIGNSVVYCLPLLGHEDRSNSEGAGKITHEVECIRQCVPQRAVRFQLSFVTWTF